MKKWIKRLALILGLILLAGAGIVGWMSRPINKEDALKAIDNMLEKEVTKNQKIPHGLVKITSPRMGIDYTFAQAGAGSQSVDGQTPFHVASIGKTFTATIIMQLVEEGMITLDQPIASHFEEGFLEELFVVEGVDYQNQVTVRHLLSHTSGLADYFEDPVAGGVDTRERIIRQTEEHWTPEALVNLTRNHQTAFFPPGVDIHYSDTGYILLGLLAESVTGRPFHELLHDHIFQPLSMEDTYLMFYSEPASPKRPMGHVWVNGVDLREEKSLSVDWSGGGIVSTLNDLTAFTFALNRGLLVSEASLKEMYTFDHQHMGGIHYGLGVMEYHFEDFFPLLNGYPRMQGHMGALGTQMFYDRERDMVIVASFGSTDYTEGSVRMLIQIMGQVMRIR